MARAAAILMHMVSPSDALARWLPTGGGLRDEDWAGRHRLLTLLLAVGMAGDIVYGALSTDLTWAWLSTTLFVLPCLVAAVRMPGRRYPSIFVALGFTAICACFVTLTDGLTEAHFSFFVAVAALALYRHWAPFGVFLAATVIHHAVVGALDPAHVYSHHGNSMNPMTWAALHGGAVLLTAAFQVIGWRLSEAEERRAQENLDESQAQLSIAFDQTPVPMAMFSPEGVILRTNNAYRDWMGLPVDLPAGYRVSDLPLTVIGSEPGSMFAEIAESTGSTTVMRQYRRHSDDAIRWVEVNGSALRDKQGRLRLIFVHCMDITESRLHQDELRTQVRTDALTGLLSRAAFEPDLIQLLTDRRGPVSVLYLDVDRFKTVNDGSGHGAGDDLLRALGARLTAIVPEGSLVARLGGDEFVLAVPGPADIGRQTGQAILAALDAPVVIAGAHLQVSVSMGLAVASSPARAEETVVAADTAMYTAKRAGGARLKEFSDEMRVAVRDRITAEARLRKALAGALDETLPVWFQPIVDSQTGEITAAEALVRMRMPNGDILGPGHFIPAAEETGLIVPLGEHVLKLAICHLLEWGDRLRYVSVNVSPRQLAEPDFVPMLAAVLAATPRLDPSRLVLEITETALLGSSVDVRERLETIKELGVRIALDDFGTGYSSLTWLQQVPADIVKLDRSFVAGLAVDERKASIIQAVLWLAKSLNMSVVAEGVEEADDWQALREADCHYCQGYLFGKPMPADELTALLPARPLPAAQRSRMATTP